MFLSHLPRRLSPTFFTVDGRSRPLPVFLDLYTSQSCLRARAAVLRPRFLLCYRHLILLLAGAEQRSKGRPFRSEFVCASLMIRTAGGYDAEGQPAAECRAFTMTITTTGLDLANAVRAGKDC